MSDSAAPAMSDLLEVLQTSPPDARLARVAQAGAVDDVLVALADEADQLAMAEAGKGCDAADVVLSLAIEVGNPLAEVRSLRARARALAYAGRFEEALATTQQAALRGEEEGELFEAGRARLISMHALGELGRLDEAFHAGELARSVFTEIGEQAFAARADINLGIVNHRRGDAASAVRYFDRARPGLCDDPVATGQLENSRGEALLVLNDFAGSERAFAAALESFEQGNAPLQAAIAQGNLADLAVRQGRLDQAVRHFEHARRRLSGDVSPAHLVRLLAEQAEAKATLGLTDEALREFRDALGELDRLGLALEAARTRMGMGRLLLELGQTGEAETALAAAATGFEELGHRTARGRIDLMRAELAACDGRFDVAMKFARQAFAAMSARSVDEAAVRHLLARLELEDGRLDLAAAEADAGAAIARELWIAPLLADLLHLRGLIHRRRGELDSAVADLADAMGQIERIRGTLQAQRLRAAYLGDRHGIYEDLVGALLDHATPDSVARAFEVTELAKSRSILDQIKDVAAVEERTVEDDLDPTESELRADLSQARADLNALYSRMADERLAEQGPEAVTAWQAEVRQREQLADDLETRLSATSGASNMYGRPVTAGEAGSLVDSSSALLTYYLEDGGITVFVLGHNELHVERHLADTAAVEGHLRRVRFQVDRAMRPGAMTGPSAARMPADVQRELHALWTILIQPVEEHLERARRLTIVPHGLLHLVPFHALHDGVDYLVERFEVHISPSVSLLHHLRRRPSGANDSLGPAVVGVADATAPEIEEEARQVADSLGCPPSNVLIGEDATVDRVSQIAQRADLLHLACHGRFLDHSPKGSGLYLADRWMTVRDILSLRLRADLVVLSGCETGVNLVAAGDELMGLTRGFFAAGARSMLVSLWPVSDEITRLFMKSFYRRFNQGAGGPEQTSAALRSVQRELMRKHPHPAFWAPFSLVGRS